MTLLSINNQIINPVKDACLVDMDEHSHQKMVISRSELYINKYPDLKYLHAVPNGGGRTKREGGRLKAEGVKRGAFDLYLDVKRGGYSGLRIELKRPPVWNGRTKRINTAKMGRPTEEQIDWQLHYQRNGFCAEFIWGWEISWKLIIWYLEGADLECVP